MKPFIALATAVALTLINVAAQATPVFNQELQADTPGWAGVAQFRGNYGAITQVSPGTIGLPSGTGSSHVLGNKGDDGAWEAGQGFDVAPTGSSGTHQRGFLFHLALTSTGLLIGSVVDLNRQDSNDPFLPIAKGNHYGWLTFVEVPHGLAMDKTKLDVVPGSLLLLGSGLVGLGLYRRRRAGSEK